jgi:hypothetical protein
MIFRIFNGLGAVKMTVWDTDGRINSDGRNSSNEAYQQV